jgi:hypothetical protein
MKQLTLITALTAVLLSHGFAQSAEDAAIKATALDYIESWYEANPARMERALHPQLAKRIFEPGPDGKIHLDHMTADQLIAGVRKGGGKNTPPEKQQKDVTILDVYENIATVKVVASSWIDHLQMAKVDGHWKIINVLWELKPKPAAQAAAN